MNLSPHEIEPASAELLEIFALEAEDHLRSMRLELAALDDASLSGGQKRDALQTVSRSAHTLKGTAGIVGLTTVAKLAHRMEDLLDKIYDDEERLTREAIHLLLAATDALENLMRDGAMQMEADSTLEDSLHELYENFAALLAEKMELSDDPNFKAGKSEAQETQANAAVFANDNRTVTEAKSDAAMARNSANSAQNRQDRIVRVPLARLQALMKLAGEMVAHGMTVERHFAALQGEFSALQANAAPVRHLSAELEIEQASGARDSRQAAIFNPQAEIFAKANELFQTLESAMAQQRRLTIEIEERLSSVCMLPLASIAPRLQRAVQVLAEQQRKLVDFTLEDRNVELDSVILHELVDSFLHLLRNAVDHGIETPEERRACGKPEYGKIIMRATQDSGRALIEIEDDGRGLDAEAIRVAAVRENLIAPDAAARMSDKEAWSLIFHPRLTTARTVSEISGRGIGMDVVKVTITDLRGAIEIDSTPRVGTRFRFHLPLKFMPAES